jgi:hypothetical protein
VALRATKSLHTIRSRVLYGGSIRLFFALECTAVAAMRSNCSSKWRRPETYDQKLGLRGVDVTKLNKCIAIGDSDGPPLGRRQGVGPFKSPLYSLGRGWCFTVDPIIPLIREYHGHDWNSQNRIT